MKVFITSNIPHNGLEMLKKFSQLDLDINLGYPLSYQELLDGSKDADAVICTLNDRIDEGLIKHSKAKVFSTFSVGFDHIDLEAASSRAIYISNTPGDLTESVAEHCIALMLSLGRHIVEGDTYVRNGSYKHWDHMLYLGPKFAGKTLGIIGMGRIGYHLAKICKSGFGMHVFYYDQKRNMEAEKDFKASYTSLDDLLENSDVISVNCFLDECTHHLIGEKEFRKMKPSSYIINTARGPVINEEALVRALTEKWIEGAGLDVFEHEPKIHPELLKLSNVVLTPHIGSATRESRLQMSKMCAENIIDVLINNQPPKYLVNKDLIK